jgi:CheY-like chemotaxis protein
MPSGASGASDGDSGRIGGARADFVASLGRKVNDARELLALLDDDPSSKTPRDELRRRLHALGSGARLFRFEGMSHSLQEALAVLDRGAQAGAMGEEDVGFLAQILDDLPALAWGEVPSREARSPDAASAETGPTPLPIAVLVVGDEALANALTEAAPEGTDATHRTRAFECERTDDADKALELARAHAPDLLLVDTDLPRAPELVEALLDDPLTDPVPVVVVGTFRTPEELARFVALGAARTLARPVAQELLRATCDEVVDTRDGHTVRVTLGEPTLEQLADRLSEELKRALVDSVDGSARSQRIPLGEGTEVLGALWGAIARVQEIVVQKTDGAIRFGGETPEGAIALAPSLHQDLPGADRFVGRGRGAAEDVRLQGRRVVVADDDPGVTWFISDLLRTAGCEVHEALDGTTALDLAFRMQPELVVSDILMPGMDGFALCRALRRDVALRDTPVILLSWKEDLLQRVRELGASAAAYMRKEAGSRAILARVREVLRPRARIELRLRGEGEMRGRLDGLSPRLLLELICIIRKDARLAVRDATYLYEIEIRAGAPRKATRTASDGSYLSGERALASLLGVGAGRFAVTSGTTPIHGELVGKLSDQLVRPLSRARGALTAVAGAHTAKVERIVFDEHALAEYLVATPEPTRTLIEQLARGAAPRRMLLGGEVSPSLLEDVLSDLAARGTIRAVEGANGVDLLSPAIDSALALLRAAAEPRRSPPPPKARASAPPPAGQRVVKGAAAAKAPSERPAPPREAVGSSDAPPATAEEAEGAPSSLEDAVMRELSDRSEDHRTSRTPLSAPPIIEPKELRPRSSNPPIAQPGSSDEPPTFPSIPPDAVVPAAMTSEELAAAQNAPVTTEPPPASSIPAVAAAPAPAPEKKEEGPSTPGDAAPVDAAPVDKATADAATADAAPQIQPAGPPAALARPTRKWWGFLFAVGLLGIAVAVVVHSAAQENEPEPGRPAAVPPVNVPTAIPGSTAPTVPSASAADDLPPGAEVPPGFGLLEVTAAPQSAVRVDGTVIGAGPFAATVTTPGYHEVRVERGGRASTDVVEVRAGKSTRVRSATVP